MTVIDGRTTAKPYVFNVPDGSNAPHYDLTPLLTVGDEVPLLEGEFGSYTPSETQTFAMAGIPDGLGVTQIDDLYYVWVNQELGASVTTDVSSTVEGQINGARVSLFIFDENWNAIGGKNLIETVEADGTVYTLDLESGNYLDVDGNLLNEGVYGEDIGNFSRFCSGYLAAKGFVDEQGNEIPVYFAPEEDGAAARGWAITPDGTATAIEGLGRYAKEQVFAASQYRADSPSGKTVLLSMEDNGDGEVYMYVGEQTAEDPNGFSDTTNSLYVLRVEDKEGNVYSYEDMPENVEVVGKWISVPDHVTLSPEGEVLSDWVNGEFNTLNGQPPLVIAHRGASGSRPEHTLESYKLAIEQGADFIEPDLVATKDGVLITRHESELAVVQLDENGEIVFDENGKPIVTSETTNVADLEQFADRLTIKEIDGKKIAGWFSEDFTYQEIDEFVLARERIPGTRPDNAEFNDQFKIPTLEDVINLVKEVETETGRKIGIYPETKHPTYFAKEGTLLDGTPINMSLGQKLIDVLVENNFTDPDRIFIQSFEIENLIELHETIMPAAGLEIPLVQLLGDFTDASVNEGGGGFSVPYDVVYNFTSDNSDANPSVYDGFPIEFDANTYYGNLANPEVINYIGTYASGLGPWKNSFLLRDSLETPVDGNSDGVAEIRTQLTGEILPLIDWAHDAGMQVHPYTLRNEENFLTLNIDGTPQTPEEEFKQLIELGVDGFFTDYPGTGNAVRDQVVAEYESAVRSTNFRRLEDMHEDPNNPGTFYLVTTGRTEKNGSLTEDAETPEEADNPYGKLHRFTLNPDDPTGEMKFEFLMSGGPDQGVSFDNMVVDSNGNVLIQEDETAFGGDVMDAEGRDGSVLSYNIAENEGVVGDDQVTFLFEIDQTIEGAEFDNGTGGWETSGIIEVDPNALPGQSSYLFDVQAHGIRNDSGVYEGQYEQGGQLLLAKPAATVSGSGVLVGGESGEILEASAGNDTVAGDEGGDLIVGGDGDDVLRGDRNRRSSGGSTGGNDEIYGGAGNDQIGGKGGNDFLFGEDGDDQIWGDDGDDLLRGGLGNDTLTGDDFSGGSGSDTFVLAIGEGTDTIVDFEIGEDFLGLADGLTFEELSFTQDGSNALINFSDETLAILNAVQVNDLIADTFVVA
ncbi:glycerophosphodiester phosphodiesterase family protein [Lyngbya aestuarii]|uniref:glycerophosphodiester phosphodiesterase family protein n=1 Tax=Lyngbya aestuarii TaxID=118322 RepID=UPI00403D7661